MIRNILYITLVVREELVSVGVYKGPDLVQQLFLDLVRNTERGGKSTEGRWRYKVTLR